MSMGDYTGEAPLAPPPEAKPKVVETALDKLRPDSELHTKVLQYLLNRLNYSERSMTQFYSRWNASERKLQAYISLPDYEQLLKEQNKTGAPPAVVSIVVPYSYATIWTIVTYLIHTFCGQKPIFQCSAYNALGVENAPYMETMLQYNADHSRVIQHFIQWFLDAETYGVGAMRNLWSVEKGTRSVWTTQPIGGMAMPTSQQMRMKQRVTKTVYEGNQVDNIDPFMFFPDPRVPMAEVNRRGEFVFWRSFEGKHTLKRAEANGDLKHIDGIKDLSAGRTGEATGKSVRSLLAQGDSSPGDPMLRDMRATTFYQIDQGTIEIVPSELGLGESNVPEKWLFSIGNKSQIIQAEPLDYDHGRHPVAIIEPSSFGYAFGQPGTMDFLGPIQDTLSWFINSHIHNVRTALNNMFIVDPSMVEMQDLKNPGPGKIIRLKRQAYGQDVRTLLQQLPVQDVTGSHIESMQTFLRMGDILSAVNDNLRGIQEQGGRKTATEVRTSGEAGASRLAARARYISAQGMIDLAEQMSLNIQQMQSMEFYLKVVGPKGMEHPIMLTPDMMAGDFYFPVNDGTLPIDKTALLGVWKELLMGVAGNEKLAATYSLDKIFEFVAELGGARNISSFKVTTAPDGVVNDRAASGALVPVGPRSAGTPAPGG